MRNSIQALELCVDADKFREVSDKPGEMADTLHQMSDTGYNLSDMPQPLWLVPYIAPASRHGRNKLSRPRGSLQKTNEVSTIQALELCLDADKFGGMSDTSRQMSDTLREMSDTGHHLSDTPAASEQRKAP
ncbi:hypothetical protein [Sporosarcina trichiuri]|uniref:hypothetical protein n=1 Tax=Sporosarcina trichiuri TaxID=3056445 RepID=UPI0025B5556B|nr:hypothetical protein [Sporosarcina sp. 0.2-SM1T-5]WJY26338.1 hypothetical protein QWT68_09595 [Sporosarcina sp. 0.2-SM1T-5]